MMEKVKSYRRRIAGKVRLVSGYSRPERPVGRKKKVSKKSYSIGRRRLIQDQYGHIVGTRRA